MQSMEKVETHFRIHVNKGERRTGNFVHFSWTDNEKFILSIKLMIASLILENMEFGV